MKIRQGNIDDLEQVKKLALTEWSQYEKILTPENWAKLFATLTDENTFFDLLLNAESCIEKAKENNEKLLALHTSEFMNAARHIYEKLGFKIIKELEPRLGKKYWLYELVING